MQSSRIGCGALVVVLVSCLALQTLAVSVDNCKKFRDQDNQLGCNEENYKSWFFMSQFLPDLCDLPNQCDMSEYLEKRFIESEQAMDQTRLGLLKKHVDDEFIKAYQKEHPREPALHLGFKRGADNCCASTDTKYDTDKTQNLLLDNYGPMLLSYEKNEGVTREQVYEAVTHFMYENIVIPCDHYVDIMRSRLFGELKDAAKLLKDNWSFLSKQSDEFRRGVFRYQWCRRFKNPNLKPVLKSDVELSHELQFLAKYLPESESELDAGSDLDSGSDSDSETDSSPVSNA